MRVLDRPGISLDPGSTGAVVRTALTAHAARLGLKAGDLEALAIQRDYTSRSSGVRHLLFRQVVDGHPVFDSAIAVHVHPDGSVLRITSNGAPVDGRDGPPAIAAARALAEAEAHSGGRASAPPSLTWLPVDGSLRLAWHLTLTGDGGDVTDVLIDAHGGDLLIRRSRVHDTDGSGRVQQSAATAALDPRRPDPTPEGAAGMPACPPPANYALRPLHGQFRDPATVLDATGRLEGNNVRVFRGNGGASATGTFDGAAWLFDFPFNSAGSAETFLFFAANFAHDFFYDLGFDEAAGNFQVSNFGRGGAGSDPIRVNARAPGRNNATYVHAPDGSSPTINMFLWDGSGCWAEDVDGDGAPDLDGDYDLDIFIHEFHHGVSHRLNTAFTGNEAGAIGEGGSDFFAYSVNDDDTLAEYSRPGGLRRINDKGYGNWACLLGLICEVHDNGEIWANVMWDVRQRFKADLVRGSEAAAINEAHQLYVDGLTLSPPAPTMLDMRDAILLADSLRNGSSNSCALWESFAGRGMGVSARDTADNGFNRVTASYDVPQGCNPPPPPPVVSIAATAPQAREAGLVPGLLTVTRGTAGDRDVVVRYLIGGTATNGADYTTLPGTVVIPAGTADVTIAIAPLDDAVVENNESVTVTVTTGNGYVPGTPASATVSIVSDDVAPDFVVSTLTAPQSAAEGAGIQVMDTTRNQGSGAGQPSHTRYYLSRNALFDSTDTLLGERAVPALAAGAASTATTPLTLPAVLDSGTWFIFAKADGLNAHSELNESNNSRLDSIAIGPDLVVAAISAAGTAAPGGTVLVSETTANNGGGSAPESLTRLYLSANVSFDAGDILLQSRSVPALAAGLTSTAATPVGIPPNTTAGTYYLIARADGAGSIAEPNENNNTRATSIRIGPDLSVSALSAPSRGAAGAPLTITETTRNGGADQAPPSATAFYLSSNLTLDAADFRLQPARAVPALGANESSTAATVVTLPDVAPGTWYILARADDGAAVAETLETNNVRFTGIQVGPDLTVSLTVASPAVAGGSVSLTTVVRNPGAAEAPASVVYFYLSANPSLDGGDVRLDASRIAPALAGGASHTATTIVPLPPESTGHVYVLAVADAAQAVQESNESNNGAARAVEIK